VTSAIHFKHELEGNLWPEAKGGLIYRSGYWDPKTSGFDPSALLGGWIFLHTRKSEVSFHGGEILGFDVEERPEFAHSARVIFRYEARKEAKNVSWPKSGRSDVNAWCSGIVNR
jgi:hypothetical protein